MVQEDYVSLETAKLLKEKGFKGPEEHFYENNEIVAFINYWKRLTPEQRYEAIEAPTLQMTMKWLREVYDIHIVIFPSSFIYGDKYTYSIYYKRNKKDENYQLHFQSREKTFEDAVNEAIKHCLTNLI